MIRLLGIAKTTLQRSKRLRISNSLAAFAAIMLYASTQVPAPEISGQEAAEQAPASYAGTEHGDSYDTMEDRDGEEQAAPYATATASKSKQKSRGLNLSLFLLGR